MNLSIFRLPGREIEPPTRIMKSLLCEANYFGYLIPLKSCKQPFLTTVYKITQVTTFTYLSINIILIYTHLRLLLSLYAQNLFNES